VKKGKRTLLFAPILAFCILLCSCDLSLTKGENLTVAPSLFKDQQSIMKALSSSVNENIVLEYPRTGENRSAFLLCDLDSDSQNEAVAFYKSASAAVGADTVHINILDKNEKGQWVSLCDSVGQAASIDRVGVGTFMGHTEIIIGWELIKDRQKTLVCYSLSGKNLIREYTAEYVEFAVSDFYSQNEGSELITLNYEPTQENAAIPQRQARLIVKSEIGFEVKSTALLDSRVTGYKNCTAGKYDSESIGYFIDGQIDTTQATTQILTVSKNGELLNPLLKDDLKTADDNLHKIGLVSQDFDGDSILEVPYQETVTGYEGVPESEKIYKTVFKHLENGELVKSAVVYMNSALSLQIAVPNELDGNVTIKPNMAQNEIVFYEFDTSLENSTKPLFSVKSVKKELYEKTEGYDVLISNDYITVSVKLFDSENELCPSWQTLYEIINIL